MGNKFYNVGRYIGMIWGIVMVGCGFGGFIALGAMSKKSVFITITQNLEIFLICIFLIGFGVLLFLDSKSE